MNPLTPKDCNLRDFQFMPLDVVSFCNSELAILSTGEEFRCALLLWCVSWHQVPAASLPDNDVALAHFARVSLKRWAKIRDSALRGWIKCDDGRLYHPLIAEKAINAWARKKSNMARMNRRLHIASEEWAMLRTQVFARDDYTCRYCGVRGVKLECDHVTPVAAGGTHDMNNLVTACFDCNRSKGAKTLKEWKK